MRAEIQVRGDSDGTAGVRAGLAQIAWHVASLRHDCARRPRLIQISTNSVEVLLDEPTLPAPPGWTPEASGAVWSRQRPLPVTDPAATAPTLVSIGRSDPDTEVMLDLDTGGLISIAGTMAAVRQLLRSIVLELVNSASAIPSRLQSLMAP